MGQVYYNSFIGVFVCLLAANTDGSLYEVFKYDFTPTFILCILGVIAFSLILNFATILCLTANSPMSTAVTGSFKDLMGTMAGIIFFGDVTLNFYFTTGLALSLIGAVHYSYVKYKQTVNEHRTK